MEREEIKKKIIERLDNLGLIDSLTDLVLELIDQSVNKIDDDSPKYYKDLKSVKYLSRLFELLKEQDKNKDLINDGSVFICEDIIDDGPIIVYKDKSGIDENSQLEDTIDSSWKVLKYKSIDSLDFSKYYYRILTTDQRQHLLKNYFSYESEDRTSTVLFAQTLSPDDIKAAIDYRELNKKGDNKC